MTDNTPDQLAEAVEALTLVRLSPTATFADLPQEVREALTDVRLAPAATFADLPQELRERVCPSPQLSTAHSPVTS